MSGADIRSQGLRIGMRLLAATWRFRVTAGADSIRLPGGRTSCVVAFWHGQMFPVWYWFRHLRPTAIVSASRDGSVLASYLARLGYRQVLRGSSSRGGSDVLHMAIEALRVGHVLITPDGPRGPARRAKAGALVAAVRAGVPLVLCGWRSSGALTLHSWDRMRVPLPFSSIEMRFQRFDTSGIPADQRIGDHVFDDLSLELDALSEANGNPEE